MPGSGDGALGMRCPARARFERGAAMAKDTRNCRSPSAVNRLPHGHEDASLRRMLQTSVWEEASAGGLCRRREARSERSMHSDRAMERRSARCAQSQASSGRSDRPQLARPVSSGRRDSHFSRRTEPRTKGPASTPSSTRAACGGPTSNPAAAAFPRGRPYGQTRATGITHPGFYGGKPWRKPDNAVIITGRRKQGEGLQHPPQHCRQSVHKS